MIFPLNLTWSRLRVPEAKFACFDVFDTLVSRRVTAPTDVFRLMYRRMVVDEQLSSEHVDEDAFVAARRRAESIALQTKEECELEEIWHFLSQEIAIIDPGKGIIFEIESEKSLVFAIENRRKLVNDARKSGKECVFISDTYLPYEFIISIMYKFKIMKSCDSLYVSSAVNKTKRTGSIYRHIMAEKKAVPRDFVMLGDNQFSDVIVPRRLGWKARLVGGIGPTSYELNASKQAALPRLERATLCGTIRAGRLQDDQSGLSALVHSFLGPACVLWAIWVLLMARIKGIDRLLFMARDSYLAFKCATIAVELMQLGIDCRYFHGSRKSLCLASTTKINRAQLDWVIQPWDCPTWSNLLRRLEIADVSQFPEIVDLIDDMGLHAELSKKQLATAFDALTKGGIRQKIATTADQKKKMLLKYLSQEALFECARPCIVDVGWHLSAQKYLRRITGDKRLTGLYLCLQAARARFDEAGPAWSMLGQPATDAKFDHDSPLVVQQATLTEHIFGLAPHGAVQSYKFNGDCVEPVMQSMEDRQVCIRSEICAMIDRYARENISLFLEIFTSTEHCVMAFRQLTDVYLSRPPSAGLDELSAAVYVSSDPDNVEAEPIAMPFSVREALALVLPASIVRRKPGRPWPAASVSISSKLVRAIIEARSIIDRARRSGARKPCMPF